MSLLPSVATLTCHFVFLVDDEDSEQTAAAAAANIVGGSDFLLNVISLSATTHVGELVDELLLRDFEFLVEDDDSEAAAAAAAAVAANIAIGSDFLLPSLSLASPRDDGVRCCCAIDDGVRGSSSSTLLLCDDPEQNAAAAAAAADIAGSDFLLD